MAGGAVVVSYWEWFKLIVTAVLISSGMTATAFAHACAYLQRRASSRAACNLDSWHKAEADFATWLVMAKLGGFNDLRQTNKAS
jgi:hypothetical protein